MSDIEIPAEIPRKRKALEAALDSWIAVWLTGELPPSQRRRLEVERERRKQLKRSQSRVVAIVTGREGFTPPQKVAIVEALTGAHPTRTLHVPAYADIRDAIQASDLVIAGPRESAPPKNTQVRDRSSVWHAIDYAKHRGIPVKIIMPNGEEGSLA